MGGAQELCNSLLLRLLNSLACAKDEYVASPKRNPGPEEVVYYDGRHRYAKQRWHDGDDQPIGAPLCGKAIGRFDPEDAGWAAA